VSSEWCVVEPENGQVVFMTPESTKLPASDGALIVTVIVALPPGVTETGMLGETDTSVNGAATVKLSMECGQRLAELVKVRVYVN
jgi:hypothetical protein